MKLFCSRSFSSSSCKIRKAEPRLLLYCRDLLYHLHCQVPSMKNKYIYTLRISTPMKKLLTLWLWPTDKLPLLLESAWYQCGSYSILDDVEKFKNVHNTDLHQIFYTPFSLEIFFGSNMTLLINYRMFYFRCFHPPYFVVRVSFLCNVIFFAHFLSSIIFLNLFLKYTCSYSFL